SFVRRRELFMSIKILSGVAFATIFCHAVPATVVAAPILQLYVEGATYDSESESWVYTARGSSGGDPFRLWAIGNVSGPGGKGTIYDVRLAAAYDESYDHIEISLSPVTTGGYGGFTDPSIPFETGAWIQTNTDGST